MAAASSKCRVPPKATRFGATSLTHCSISPSAARHSCVRCRCRRARAEVVPLPARLVLASANAGKQREFAALLAPLGIDLLLQSALGIASIPETGTTFEANALLKARHAASQSGLPALADDSGLEVDALGGRPGIRSARYAGESASDHDNNAKL